jgi:hypothetical protein
MESDSDPILETPHKVGIDWCCGRGEVPGADLPIHRQQATKPELHSATVAPGANSVGERGRLNAALKAETAKGVGHKTLA